MRCNKAKVKQRFSKTEKGHPGNYAHSMKGHTWKRNGLARVCINCGKKVRRLSEKNN